MLKKHLTDLSVVWRKIQSLTWFGKVTGESLMYLFAVTRQASKEILHTKRDIEYVKWPKPAQTRSSSGIAQRRNMHQQKQLHLSRSWLVFVP